MTGISETRLVTLVALIQFVFVIDFMMVAPLGPDYSGALNADNSDIGLVVASYTIAAAISGLLLARFLDRFDRRSVIIFFLTGLSVTTIACAFSNDITDLIVLRFVAGFFGGPAATIAISMIIDVVPEVRRGKSIGKVMSAFSMASIIGIPIGLELSHRGGWEVPFYAVGALILLTALMIRFLLPVMKQHLVHDESQAAIKITQSFKTLFYRPEALVTYLMTMTSMLAAFFIIPNIAAFMQFNLGYPRDSYGLLYFMGGVISLLVMRVTGKWIDKFDIKLFSVAGTVGIVVIVYCGFVLTPSLVPAVVLFVGYMSAMSIRNVVSVSMSSMVPSKHERAAFTSLNQSVSHFSAGAGALISSYYLSSNEAGDLVGIDSLAIWAIGLSLFMPACVFYLSRFVKIKNSFT